MISLYSTAQFLAPAFARNISRVLVNDPVARATFFLASIQIPKNDPDSSSKVIPNIKVEVAIE